MDMRLRHTKNVFYGGLGSSVSHSEFRINGVCNNNDNKEFGRVASVRQCQHQLLNSESETLFHCCENWIDSIMTFMVFCGQ